LSRIRENNYPLAQNLQKILNSRNINTAQ
jgi:hypothetical protein